MNTTETTPDTIDSLKRERVTRETARNWQGRILMLLSKRDNDDLSRLSVRLGDAGIIRFFAARYMDPFFSTTREDAAYRKFGEAVESAYHTMLAELAAAREADKAEKGAR
jgi:hypothetical protein